MLQKLVEIMPDELVVGAVILRVLSVKQQKIYCNWTGQIKQIKE